MKKISRQTIYVTLSLCAIHFIAVAISSVLNKPIHRLVDVSAATCPLIFTIQYNNKTSNVHKVDLSHLNSSEHPVDRELTILLLFCYSTCLQILQVVWAAYLLFNGNANGRT